MCSPNSSKVSASNLNHFQSQAYDLESDRHLPGEVVVVEVQGDELVKGPEGVLRHPGHLVGRHGQGLQLVWTAEGRNHEQTA